MGEPVHSPLPWEDAAYNVSEALLKQMPDVLCRITDDLYDRLMTATQDYLKDNVEYNLKSALNAANRDAATARAERDALQARVREAEALLTSIKRHGELGNVGTGGWQGNKPAGNPMSKDVWQFPRHMLVDLDAFLSSSTGADHD